jgi:hypothetical protein
LEYGQLLNYLKKRSKKYKLGTFEGINHDKTNKLIKCVNIQGDLHPEDFSRFGEDE